MSGLCLAAGKEGGMKVLLAALLLLGASTVYAQSDPCGTMPTAEQQILCLRGQVAFQQFQLQQQRQHESDLARQQAAGMALFGSGNALINGMNQGFQHMQVHPYVLPPAQHYPTR
jgi:hypothetical protein